MKGFKDSSGKFHPITDYKGVRKSRDQSAKIQGVKIERKKRFLSEDDVDRLSHLELNAILIDVEKRWRKKELFSDEGDHKVIIFTCIEHPEYTFELHPMDDNELEDEHGKELEEPIYHDAWYWFPAKHGKGVPNSPTTMSETGGYTRKDVIREFTKELILFDQGMNP